MNREKAVNELKCVQFAMREHIRIAGYLKALIKQGKNVDRLLEDLDLNWRTVSNNWADFKKAAKEKV